MKFNSNNACILRLKSHEIKCLFERIGVFMIFTDGQIFQ